MCRCAFHIFFRKQKVVVVFYPRTRIAKPGKHSEHLETAITYSAFCASMIYVGKMSRCAWFCFFKTTSAGGCWCSHMHSWSLPSDFQAFLRRGELWLVRRKLFQYVMNVAEEQNVILAGTQVVWSVMEHWAQPDLIVTIRENMDREIMAKGRCPYRKRS